MSYVTRWLRVLTQPWMMVSFMLLIVTTYCYLDQPLARFLHHLALGKTIPLLNWLTQLGRTIIYLLLLPVIALYVRFIKRSKQLEWRLWFVWMTIALTGGVCFVLKTILGRARPELLFSQDLFGFYGYHLSSLYHSFPSGHVTLVITVLLSLTLLFPPYRVVFMIMSGLIIATRILLTYHYLSDVLASFYIVVLEYRLLLYIVARERPLYWAKLGIK